MLKLFKCWLQSLVEKWSTHQMTNNWITSRESRKRETITWIQPEKREPCRWQMKPWGCFQAISPVTREGCQASQLAQWVKNPPVNTGDMGLIPRLGRSPGEGNGNPLQFSHLENPMDREAWQSTVHGVAKSQTWLKWLSTYTGKAPKDRTPRITNATSRG